MKSSASGPSPPSATASQVPEQQVRRAALFGRDRRPGRGLVTGQFYALFFLLIYLKLDFIKNLPAGGLSLLDRHALLPRLRPLSIGIGRLKIILAGCAIAALTYFPLLQGPHALREPCARAYQIRVPSRCTPATAISTSSFGPWSKQTPVLTGQGLPREGGLSSNAACDRRRAVVMKIGDKELHGWDEAKYKAALTEKGYPPKADLAQVNWVIGRVDPRPHGHLRDHGLRAHRCVLVELFRPNPLHVDVLAVPHRQRWFGGMLPLLATAIVAKAGTSTRASGIRSSCRS